MGMFDDITNFFSGGSQNGYNDAMKYENQIPGLWNQMNPWMNAGKNAMPGYMNTLGSLTNDPSGYMNNIMKNYYQSPMYNAQMSAATNAADQAGAASGNLGTVSQMQAAEQAAGNVASQNQNNYMNQVMGGLGMGLNGTQSMIGMGNNDQLQKIGGLTDNINNQANTAFNEDRAQTSGFQNALAFGGKSAADYATGGLSGMFGNMFGSTGGSGGGSGSSLPAGVQQDPNAYQMPAIPMPFNEGSGGYGGQQGGQQGQYGYGAQFQPQNGMRNGMGQQDFNGLFDDFNFGY